jgi:hypothetical protein
VVAEEEAQRLLTEEPIPAVRPVGRAGPSAEEEVAVQEGPAEGTSLPAEML